MTPEQLKSAIIKRSLQAVTLLEGGGRNSALDLVVHLASPLSGRDLEQLEVEGWMAASHPVPGTLGVLRVDATEAGVSIVLQAIDGETVRLDTLFRALALRGSPLGSSLSAYVIQELARTADALHRAPDPSGQQRVHGAIHKGAVLVSQDGSLLLVGPGLPFLNAILVHQPKDEIDRFRFLAPEALRGEALDPRTDVYGLGVLYYELLSGHGYRRSQDGSEIFQATLEGHPPELPGDLPDPRPELIAILERALAPNRGARFPSARELGAAVGDEVERIGLRPDSKATLAASVREFVAPETDHGPRILISEGEINRHDSKVIGAPPPPRGESDIPHVIEETVAPRTPEPEMPPPLTLPVPAMEPAPKAAEPESPKDGHFAADDWAAVLGDSVPPNARPSAPPRLPLPAAEASTMSPTPGLGLGPIEERAPLPSAPASAKASTENPLFALQDAGPIGGKKKKAGSDVGRFMGVAAIIAIFFALVFLMLRERSEAPEPGRKQETRRIFAPRVPKKDKATAPTGAGASMGDGKQEAEPPPSGTAEATGAKPAVEGAAARAPVPGQTVKPVFLISILSTPSGATVELDGGYVGKTPLVMRHPFEKGSYKVTIANEGYKTWSQEVQVDPEKGTLTVNVILQK